MFSFALRTWITYPCIIQFKRPKLKMQGYTWKQSGIYPGKGIHHAISVEQPSAYATIEDGFKSKCILMEYINTFWKKTNYLEFHTLIKKQELSSLPTIFTYSQLKHWKTRNNCQENIEYSIINSFVGDHRKEILEGSNYTEREWDLT